MVSVLWLKKILNSFLVDFRWNAIKSEKAKFNPKYPFLVPKPYERVDDDNERKFKTFFEKSQLSHKVSCQVRKRFAKVLNASSSSASQSVVQLAVVAASASRLSRLGNLAIGEPPFPGLERHEIKSISQNFRSRNKHFWVSTFPLELKTEI